MHFVIQTTNRTVLPRIFGITAVTSLLFLFVFATPTHALAQPDVYMANAMVDLFDKYINPFVVFLSAFAGVAIVLSIIIGGVQYSSAGSDPNKVSAAKKRITNALVALAFFIFLLGFLQWVVPGGL